MKTAVIVTGNNKPRGANFGSIAGDLANLNPSVTHVWVTFPGLAYPNNFKLIALRRIREATLAEILWNGEKREDYINA